MTGFVYIWRDRKHGRFYVGSHWGREDDSYICSSTWMRNAYKRRPGDFKRRVLVSSIPSRRELLETEHRFLSMIKQHELGKRYYNHTTHVPVLGGDGSLSNEVRHRLSEARKNRTDCPRTGKKHSEATKQRYREMRKGRTPWNKGKTLSVDHRSKLSEAHVGQVPWNKGLRYTHSKE